MDALKYDLKDTYIMPDAEQISAGASAVLIIAVLIFNLSARFLGQKLYQHLTAAKQG